MVLNYLVDSVDETTEMQACTQNKIAHMISRYNKATTCNNYILTSSS